MISKNPTISLTISFIGVNGGLNIPGIVLVKKLLQNLPVLVIKLIKALVVDGGATLFNDDATTGPYICCCCEYNACSYIDLVIYLIICEFFCSVLFQY